MLRSTLSKFANKSILNFNNATQHQQRNIFWLLYSAINKPDPDRIKEVGPDKACAEWLVKCGASVKFHNRQTVFNDYMQLGSVGNHKMKLAEVDAEQATIMDIGFVHFNHVDQVEKMSFKRCASFDNACISQIVKHLSGCLKDLEIVSCGDVSDSGLQRLHELKALQQLRLFELPAVKNKKEAFESLSRDLPNCHITYEDEGGFKMETN